MISDLILSIFSKIAGKAADHFFPNPEEKEKFLIEMEKISVEEMKLHASAMESVNATMREEAKSEHWVVYSWRPAIGYSFIAVVINNYVLLPYLRVYGILPIDIPAEIWSSMLVILGVSAGTRGIEKIFKQKGIK